MSPRTRMACLLAICFLATAGEVLTVRGLYFYTKATLEFSDGQNLALALGLAALSVMAALLSHPLAQWLGPKRLLTSVFGAMMLCDLALAIRPSAGMVVGVTLARASVSLMKWPVLQSYISAGLTPRRTSAALGWYNLSWAIAPLLALPLVGPIIEYDPRGLFLGSLLLNAGNLALMNRLERRPVHLEDDHPEHLAATELHRYRALLISGRWSMLSNSIAFALLTPLIPGILLRLEVPVKLAPLASATLDVARMAAFVPMYFLPGWRGRRIHMAGVALALPAAFLTVMFGREHLPLVLAGLALFGTAGGACYYAALYYAMVVKRASVEGGGVHEALGAMGHVIGPAVGLGGREVARWTGWPFAGSALGAMPLLAALAGAALWPLWRLPPRRAEAPPPAPTQAEAAP